MALIMSGQSVPMSSNRLSRILENNSTIIEDRVDSSISNLLGDVNGLIDEVENKLSKVTKEVSVQEDTILQDRITNLSNKYKLNSFVVVRGQDCYLNNVSLANYTKLKEIVVEKVLNSSATNIISASLVDNVLVINDGTFSSSTYNRQFIIKVISITGLQNGNVMFRVIGANGAAITYDLMSPLRSGSHSHSYGATAQTTVNYSTNVSASYIRLNEIYYIRYNSSGACFDLM